MKKIEITVEIVKRCAFEVELSDEQYEAFINGEADEITMQEIDLSEMFERCRNGEGWEDTDYSITDNNGETVVPWND